MTKLIEQLKESGQDFEFYPTTNEIIAALVRDVVKMKNGRVHRRHSDEGYLSSILDIGAGHGKVLRAFKEARKPSWRAEIPQYSDESEPLFTEFYAIEKSHLLCEQLDPDVFIVGTEFHEQSLISKQVDVTFCNPPYSEFTEWAVKIIRESSSKLVYLVIPTRWSDSLEIAAAVKFRDAKVQPLGVFTFHRAEDRQARAVVNLLRIELPTAKDDAFDRFFDETFGALKEKFQAKERTDESDETRQRRYSEEGNPKFRQLVVGPSYPDALVELYNSEMDHIRKNYDLVAQLDADLLKEFDITPSRILGCLKARLTGLRNTYWQELFANMKQVTDRLCSKKRDALLKKLNQSGAVDFTLGNIHAVVIWVLKNANQYIDEQLCEVFEDMVEKANVRNYKSNERVFTNDRWRYNEEKPSHVALEYRLVLSHCGGIQKGYSFERGLSTRGSEFIGDLLTVARNLGFESTTARPGRGEDWKSAEVHTFHLPAQFEVGDKVPWTDRVRKKVVEKVKLESGKYQYRLADVPPETEWVHENCLQGEPLFEVRAYFNNNMHVRLNQKFALALNVEYGRLKGWLKNGAHAAEELGDADAPRYFSKQVKLGTSSLPMLAA